MENVEDVAEISASERSTCLLFEDESIQCNGGNRAPYTHPVGSEFSAFGQEWGLHYPVGSETYQWFRCDEQVSPWSSKYLTSTPSYCEEIVGADSSSYVSTADDAGHYLIFDTPGQAELYSCHEGLARLVLRMQRELDLQLASLHLVDSTLCASPFTFVAAETGTQVLLVSGRYLALAMNGGGVAPLADLVSTWPARRETGDDGLQRVLGRPAPEGWPQGDRPGP
jgi:hypothetical protein